MPTEPEPPKKQPSQLEKNVLGKGGSTQMELVPKKADVKAHLTDDVKYLQSNQEVSELHMFTVDSVFTGPVYPLPAYHNQTFDFAAEGKSNYIDVTDPGNSYGLTQSLHEKMFEVFGPNQLTPPAEDPEWLKFLKQFTGFFSLLLLAGGVLCLVAFAVRQEDRENLFLGIVLFAVVTITSFFTYKQEAASAKMMKKFKALGETKTRVIIDGQQQEIDSNMVVPGDILHVKLGDKIPCDCRVLQALGDFAVVEAALTGEPNAIKKNPKKSENPDEPALRQRNIIMSGTDIAIGEAWCMAVSTGDQNVMGRNYQMMIKAKEMKDDTPIKQEIDRFVKIISTIAIFLGILFFIINVSLDGTVSVNAIVFTIGIIVANVPEGLLATVTVSLALTAARMKDVMVLVKNLEAVETLGSTSVICSDKTGTLTMNKMTAVKAYVSGQMLTTHPVESASWSYLPPAGGHGIYEELIKCATFCGSAKFKAPEDQKGPGGVVSQVWESLKWPDREAVDGDASERAILIFNEQRLQSYDNMGVTGCKNDDIDPSVTTNSFLPVDIRVMQQVLPPKKSWTEGQQWSISQIKEHGSRVQSARMTYPTVDKLPFNSKNKWMAVTTDLRKLPKSDEKFVTWIKGGSDVVFDFCTHTMHDGRVVELSTDDKKNFAEANADLASNGLRVFAFAKVSYESLNNAVTHDGPIDDLPKYFAESMFKPDEWKDGELDESGKPVEAGTLKPITVKGRPQIPLVRPDIARARVEQTGDPAYFVPKVIFLGLLALQDPPRPAVPRAVAVCRQASIGVVMVTGDQPQTAAAIARDIGIITKTGRTEDDVIIAKLLSEPGKSRADFATDRERILKSLKTDERDSITAMAVEGTRIATWNPIKMDGNWKRALDFTWKQGLVFARTSPTQKLLIVQHFKIKESEGGPEKIVAVTGDGVNDAQAVTAADIGICMGIAGMDVTKEAADMILMNDNFASIVDGVLEGRLIFDNLKKSIAYTLSSNIPEISPFIVYILLQVPLPLSTVLILCIDLGTDMVPAISLAYETKEKDIMKRAPRTKTDNLVTERLISFSYFQIGTVQALAGFYCYFVVFYTEGFPPADLPFHGQLAGYFLDGGFPYGGFTINECLRILATAQTAFWVSIVVVQWADILICKTRKLSLFEQGMKNDQLNFGLFFETALSVFLVYVPGVRTVFGIQKLRFIYWLPALPFSLFIVVYDELRKWLIRNYPGGWLDRKTYW